MRSADDMKRLFTTARLDVHPETDERVLADVLQSRAETKTKSTMALSQWRIAMKSPIAKLTVAATIVIACAMGLLIWSGTQPSVALADVLSRMQQISIYTYQMSMTVTGSTGNIEINQNVESTALVSQDLGMKMTMEMTDPKTGMVMLQEMYMLPQKKTMLTIMPQQKMYTEVELDDTLLQQQQKSNNNPSAIVEQILQCNYESLGQSTIDGIEVEGFRTTDPNYMGGILGQTEVTVWIDVQTQLPVRFEMDIQAGETMHMKGTMYNFQWDVTVDAAEFDPVIPSDYINPMGGPMKMPPVNEESAIEGLRLCAELSGRYPEKLDMMSLMSQMENMFKPEKSDDKKESLTTILGAVKDMTENLKRILVVGTFHSMLTTDNKAPAYYGDIVTPDDADQVLMRWKVSDTEYRIIFGNLHVETVPADVLIELEKSLPK